MGGCTSAWRDLLSLVVFLIIDENGVFPLEGKREPPISIDADRPMTGKFTA